MKKGGATGGPGQKGSPISCSPTTHNHSSHAVDFCPHQRPQGITSTHHKFGSKKTAARTIMCHKKTRGWLRALPVSLPGKGCVKGNAQRTPQSLPQSKPLPLTLVQAVIRKRVMSSRGCCIIKPQNGWGWKGPWRRLVQPPADPVRAGCTGPALLESWTRPRMETSQPLWATCSRVWPTSWKNSKLGWITKTRQHIPHTLPHDSHQRHLWPPVIPRGDLSQTASSLSLLCNLEIKAQGTWCRVTEVFCMRASRQLAARLVRETAAL